MHIEYMNTPVDLFLGSDIATARAQGARRFSSAVKAVRFAMEQAAPVSLRGASFRIGDEVFGPRKIRKLHEQMAEIGQAR